MVTPEVVTRTEVHVTEQAPRMTMFKRVIARLRAWKRFLGIVYWSIIIVGTCEVWHWFGMLTHERLVWARKAWAAGLLKRIGVHVHHCPEPNIDMSQSYVVISNHRSPIDVLITLSRFGGAFLSRHDLADWFIIGWAATRAGTLYVNRTSLKSRMIALNAMSDRLKSGDSLMIFPEGRTLAGDALGPFNRGAFMAAQQAGKMIVPFGLAYPAGLEFTEPKFGDYCARVGRLPRIEVAAAMGEPIASTGDVGQLVEHAKNEVARLIKNARAELEKSR